MAGMNVDVRSLQQHKPLDLSKLSKQKRDWLEVFGNQWRAKQAMPGTCEYCVWGTGGHAFGCVTGIPVGEPVSIPRPPRYEERA